MVGGPLPKPGPLCPHDILNEPDTGPERGWGNDQLWVVTDPEDPSPVIKRGWKLLSIGGHQGTALGSLTKL